MPSASSGSSLAAQGYLVVAANYRGQRPRPGFQRAIFADWGGKEVVDLHGAIDHVVAAGSPIRRLGVGGWSYGGILTNYLIASDHRFKAATSGAGSSNQISMYGVDQYTRARPSWGLAALKSRDLWLKVLYPSSGGSDQHADPLPRREGFQRAARGRRADVPGAQEPGRAHQLVIYQANFTA
jgi:hypothetical protein